MRVVEVQGYGGPEVLAEVERPDPAPAPGRVRVEVRARVVNPVDLWTREGQLAAALPQLAAPFVLGWDLAGTVVEDAAGFRAGDRVAGMVPWFEAGPAGTGSYAGIVVAEPEWLAPLPDAVPFAAGAVAALNGQTAAQALELLDPAVRTLLVTGASGAVGGFAVELAAAAGLDVVALAAGADDEPYLTGLGAKQVLPRLAPADLAGAVRAAVPGGVDAVLDAAQLGAPALAAVRDGGAYVGVVAWRSPEAERGVTVTAVQSEPRSAQLGELLEGLAAGRLSARVAAELPLGEAAQAHRRAAAGGVRGKIVLTS